MVIVPDAGEEEAIVAKAPGVLSCLMLIGVTMNWNDFFRIGTIAAVLASDRNKEEICKLKDEIETCKSMMHENEGCITPELRDYIMKLVEEYYEKGYRKGYYDCKEEIMTKLPDILAQQKSFEQQKSSNTSTIVRDMKKSSNTSTIVRDMTPEEKAEKDREEKAEKERNSRPTDTFKSFFR
ncbi:MAG TPA: hypothetical protein VMF69_17310 [Gemmataceae bacterium]|nr:hypothetical protein [Gemmataceae bacterium]